MEPTVNEAPPNVEFALVRLPDGGYETILEDELPAGMRLDEIPEHEWKRIEEDAARVGANQRTRRYPTIHHNVRAQAHYIRCRENGCSHQFAEMLALRKFPGLKTDNIFNKGRCNGNQFEKVPGLGDHYRRIAEAAGVSVTGRFYCAGLADFPGDPTAWVSDRGDVLRVARAKGMRVHGYVEHDPGERPPMPDVPVAPELIEAEVAARLEEDPGLRIDDVREEVKKLRTGAVDPNPLIVQDEGVGDAP